jgi:hypothetical protein
MKLNESFHDEKFKKEGQSISLMQALILIAVNICSACTMVIVSRLPLLICIIIGLLSFIFMITIMRNWEIIVSLYLLILNKIKYIKLNDTRNRNYWLDIGTISKEKLKERQRLDRIELSNKWASQGLCRHCGGQIGGLFTKKCKSCGRGQ